MEVKETTNSSTTNTVEENNGANENTAAENTSNIQTEKIVEQITEQATVYLGAEKTKAIIEIIEKSHLEDKARLYNTANEFASENSKDASMPERLPFKDTSTAIQTESLPATKQTAALVKALVEKSINGTLRILTQ